MNKNNERHRSSLRASSLIALSTLGLISVALAGCTVGPDFTRPEAPRVADYTSTPYTTQTVAAPIALGQTQQIQTGLAVEAQWWHAFGSLALDRLIEQALTHSPTLAAAQATLRQAEEIYAAQAGSTQYPQINAGLNAQRQQFNPSALGQGGESKTFNLYNPNISLGYNLDLVGGNRRALEALAARTEYSRFELEAAKLTLASSLVATAIRRAQFADQIQATRVIVQNQEAQLKLTQDRLRLGQAALDEVLTLQTQLEQVRATLPQLTTQWQQTEHLLAVLAGQAPGASEIPAFTLADFNLPAKLPLMIPSALARSRPDIQAAEALLHAANADYGVALAKLYPQINLSASLGSQALTTGALFGGSSTVWNMVGQLTQPLFNPGLPAEKRAALAALDAAAAHYQGVVLEALRSVADSLRSIENDAQVLQHLAAADSAAQAAMQSVSRQYKLGAASYVQLLIAEQQAQQVRINLIAAQSQRLINSAALYQALGCGMGA
ncbi:MAG: RND transporter [Gammaproteobacteria bacterium 28-57-27]|nr:MAG: RND transporter [Gammaproteobacteria bacterium 28-57-27]